MKFSLILLLKFLFMILFVAHNVFGLNIQLSSLASYMLEFDFQSALYILGSMNTQFFLFSIMKIMSFLLIYLFYILS